MATWPMATLGSGCSGWDKNHVILVIFEPPSKQSNAIFLAKFSTKYSKLSYSRGSWTVCEQEHNKDYQKIMSSCKVWERCTHHHANF